MQNFLRKCGKNMFDLESYFSQDQKNEKYFFLMQENTHCQQFFHQNLKRKALGVNI
jgi:hypothetical protein